MEVESTDDIEELMEDDSEMEEEEEEEDVEPRLKYERLGNDLPLFMAHDFPTSLAVHPKFIALGTNLGRIRLFDHLGNCIHQSPELVGHSIAVNCISIDDNGDYLVSCSDDGKVIINGLYTTENNIVLNHDRPIKAVAIDPVFYKSGQGRRFVTGELSKLVLHEKGFLNRHKTFVLYQGESSIQSVKWMGTLIALSNNQGVHVYDMSVRKRISFIVWEDLSVRKESVRCNLCWKDEKTLLIGWGKSVKVCEVSEKRQITDGQEQNHKSIAITSLKSFDFLISGIAPLGDNLLILSYDEQSSAAEEGSSSFPNRPHLRLFNLLDYEELSNDALSIKGFQDNKCISYQLECNVEEAMFFIFSPKDFVVAKLRDEDDHITWLVEHEMFQQAMDAVSEHGKHLKKHTSQSIGTKYFDFLLRERDFDEAGKLCQRIAGRNKDQWEIYVCRFTQVNQYAVIAKYMPTRDPQLNSSMYELVLNYFLEADHEMLFHYISKWPPIIYSIEAIINGILDKLDHDRNNRRLLETLGLLYTHDKRYDKALYIYIRLKHNNVFDLIHQHNLFASISNRITTLMEFDPNATVKLLLDNMDKIPMAKVVEQLEPHMKYLHIYLDQLFHKDPHLGKDYHGLQVKLYAEYDRPKLLSFLKASNYCSLQQALKECEERRLHPERIFLLDRMGNTKQALRLITSELKDVNKAIEFCKEHDDQELWEDLITYSTEIPSFISGLLNNIGTHVDPIILIKRIQEKLEIPGLRNSLVKILQDYYLQISLREGCKKILVADCFHLLTRLVKFQKRGILVDESQTCQMCHERIIYQNVKFASAVKVYFCHHTFHDDCLPAGKIESCPICSAPRRIVDSKLN